MKREMRFDDDRAESRRRLIVERAMQKTLTRGFGERPIIQDWREAEREVDDELASGSDH